MSRVDLDVLLVAGLCGLGFVAASLLWHLIVHPELMLSLLDRRALSEPEHRQETALRWLRLVLAALVFLLGAVTGAALTLLR